MFDDTIENKTASDSTNASGENVSAPIHEARPQAVHSESSGTAGSYDFRAIIIAVTGWVLPGFGHPLLKMWGRAVTVFLAGGFFVYLCARTPRDPFSPAGDH